MNFNIIVTPIVATFANIKILFLVFFRRVCIAQRTTFPRTEMITQLEQRLLKAFKLSLKFVWAKKKDFFFFFFLPLTHLPSCCTGY
jgi:hypothetical protein